MLRHDVRNVPHQFFLAWPKSLPKSRTETRSSNAAICVRTTGSNALPLWLAEEFRDRIANSLGIETRRQRVGILLLSEAAGICKRIPHHRSMLSAVHC